MNTDRDALAVDVFIGEGGSPQQMADEMYGVWTAFINGEAPSWPRYETERRLTLHFDNSSSLVENGELTMLETWQGVR